GLDVEAHARFEQIIDVRRRILRGNEWQFGRTTRIDRNRIGAEIVIERNVLLINNDDMLDRRCGCDRVLYARRGGTGRRGCTSRPGRGGATGKVGPVAAGHKKGRADYRAGKRAGEQVACHLGKSFYFEYRTGKQLECCMGEASGENASPIFLMDDSYFF